MIRNLNTRAVSHPVFVCLESKMGFSLNNYKYLIKYIKIFNGTPLLAPTRAWNGHQIQFKADELSMNLKLTDRNHLWHDI